MSTGKKVMLAGGLLGALAVLLVKLGNPANMGFCIACFWRDISGALGFHRAEVVQYIRPEVLGLLFGAFVMSLIGKEFKPRGGSSTVLKFFLGVFLMIGALVFLGCPLRAVLRLANGDLNALVGIAGYVVGIFIGSMFLKKGYTLGKAQPQNTAAGLAMPVFVVALFMLLIAAPAFIFFSAKGPGAAHAPIYVSLIIGLILGGVIQKTRFCTAGGIRDVILIKNAQMLLGLISVFAVALLGNLIFNFDSFKLGFEGQPIAHTEHLWNFLGLMLVGICSIFLGGCPLRQTILAGEGNMDSAVVLLGFIVGAAVSHNFGMAASADKGVPMNGKIGVIVSIVIVLIIGVSVVYNEKKKKSA